MVNPFGEQSDSLIAWKERYKQLEFQLNTIKQILSETNIKLQKTTEERDYYIQEMQKLSEELSSVKRELLIFKNLAKEREDKLNRLESSTNASKLIQMQNEIDKLKEENEELHATINRGTTLQETENNDFDELMDTLLPLLLHIYDPDNEKYSDAYKNMVELSINKGNILLQVIAILIKHGGYGPIDRVKNMVHPRNQFDVAVDILKDENIVSVIDDVIKIKTLADDVSNVNNWEDMTVEEVFDNIEQIIRNESTENVTLAMDTFRDTLQDLNVPLSTMLFEIRKVKEGISKNTMTRKEAIEKVKKWRSKLLD